MKKSAVRVFVVICILVLAVVSYYAYLSNKSRERRTDANLSAVQSALSRNLENDYPPTVREVLKYYNELMRCYYNEECTDEEIEALGMKARELYDAELLEANEVTEYMERLRADIKAFRDKKRKITSISLAGSTSVYDFYQDGFHFARIQCVYNISEGGVTSATTEVYLLRQDENRRWKIYGWDKAPENQ